MFCSNATRAAWSAKASRTDVSYGDALDGGMVQANFVCSNLLHCARRPRLSRARLLKPSVAFGRGPCVTEKLSINKGKNGSAARFYHSCVLPHAHTRERTIVYASPTCLLAQPLALQSQSHTKLHTHTHTQTVSRCVRTVPLAPRTRHPHRVTSRHRTPTRRNHMHTTLRSHQTRKGEGG